MPRVNRKNILSVTKKEKAKVYEEVDRLYHQGQEVVSKEHRSGFPAITLDVGDLHYLTDCLSAEEWYAEHLKGPAHAEMHKKKESKHDAGQRQD